MTWADQKYVDLRLTGQRIVQMIRKLPSRKEQPPWNPPMVMAGLPANLNGGLARLCYGGKHTILKPYFSPEHQDRHERRNHRTAE